MLGFYVFIKVSNRNKFTEIEIHCRVEVFFLSKVDAIFKIICNNV